MILASRRADPDRPGLDALDRQDRVHPGVVGEPPADLRFAVRPEHEHSWTEIRIAERTAENDQAFFGESVDEGSVLVPRILLPARPAVGPRRPRDLCNEEVVRQALRVLLLLALGRKPAANLNATADGVRSCIRSHLRRDVGCVNATSVVHSFEVQAPRRGSRAGFVARAACQKRRNAVRRQLDHRPDQCPHHVAQEAVGGDLELERIAAALPLGTKDGALEDLVLRLRRRERAEVVLAE